MVSTSVPLIRLLLVWSKASPSSRRARCKWIPPPPAYTTTRRRVRWSEHRPSRLCRGSVSARWWHVVSSKPIATWSLSARWVRLRSIPVAIWIGRTPQRNSPRRYFASYVAISRMSLLSRSSSPYLLSSPHRRTMPPSVLLSWQASIRYISCKSLWQQLPPTV